MSRNLQTIVLFSILFGMSSVANAVEQPACNYHPAKMFFGTYPAAKDSLEGSLRDCRGISVDKKAIDEYFEKARLSCYERCFNSPGSGCANACENAAKVSKSSIAAYFEARSLCTCANSVFPKEVDSAPAKQ